MSDKPNAIVAAARPLKLNDAKATRAAISNRQAWQDESWAYFDEVGEVKFGCLFLGNGMSKVRFYAAVELEDGSRVPVSDDESPLAGSALAAQAEAEMARLKSALGGQGELNKQATINWTVAGECYLHGIEAKPAQGIPGTPDYRPEEPEQWDIRSVSEVEFANTSSMDGAAVMKIKSDPDDRGRTIDIESETLIRMWVRHARFSNRPDCHLRAALTDCEALVLFVNQQKAEAKSRQSAGILLVPSELSFAQSSESGEDDAEQNPFVSALLSALTDPIEDPTSSASVMPLVLSGPGEHLTPDKFRLMSFGRTADSTLDSRIEAKINRVARAMNVPVEVVMGHMSTTFSNAEQIDEDKFNDHFEPLCEGLADAYYSGFLAPQLLEGGFTAEDVGRVIVWYDASALVRGPGPADSADEMFDRGALSLAAYRRYKGASDEDAPDEFEQLWMLARQKGVFGQNLTLALLKAAGIVLPVDEEAMQEEAIAEAQSAARRPALAASSQSQRARRSPGRRLADVDRELRTKLLGAGEAAMSRALERAGNRLRQRNGAIAATLRTVPAYRCVAHLGPNLVASTGLTDDDLLANAWDEFEQQFKTWSTQAIDATLDVLDETLGANKDRREAQRERLTWNLNDAWVWLERALTDRAKAVLYAPERGALTAAGEQDPAARVPAGIIREGMARVGGASGIGGADGVVSPSNQRPIGGIATGDDVVETMSEGGQKVAAYEWVYGPAQRKTFEPHAVLDGVIFENFDDGVLSNFTGWPDTPFYYPGDHQGCLCDAEPTFIAATSLGSTALPVMERERGTYELRGDAPEGVSLETIAATLDDLTTRYPLAHNTRVEFQYGDDAFTEFANHARGSEHLPNRIYVNGDAWTRVRATREAEMSDYLVDSSLERGTIVHEYGHAVHEDLLQRLDDVGLDELDKLTFLSDMNTLGEFGQFDIPSIYSAESRYEMAAELFSAVHSGMTASRYGERSGERIERFAALLRQVYGE